MKAYKDGYDDGYDAGVKMAISLAIEKIDKYCEEVNTLETGRHGSIDFMKKDGIITGLSMARYFVNSLKERC